MPDAPAFRRYFDSVLYSFDAGSAAGPGWIGFIWAGSAPPPEVALADSFLEGHYLFAPSAPSIADTAAGNAYANAVVAWLQNNFGSPFLIYACVWLPNAVGPVFPAQPNAGAFAFGSTGSPASASDFNLSAGQLTFSVPSQTLMNMGAGGLEFYRIGSGQVQFNLAEGTNPPSVTGNSGLPFLGKYAGAFTVTGGLSRTGSLGTIDGMATGFHYCHQSAGTTVRQIYPVLVSGPALPDLQYSGSVDPLDLFNTVTPLSAPGQGHLRTQFAITAPARIASWYCTPSGRAIDLIPLNGLDDNGEPMPWCGALVLQSRQATNAPVQRVYLTPAGDYALAESSGTKDGQKLTMLPGLFGSERIDLTAWQAAGSFDRLRLVAGQAANAPVFPYLPANLNAPDLGKPKPRLDATYVTAWAAVLNGESGNAAYLAQPEGNPLYAPPKNAAPNALALLPPLVTPSPIPQTGPVLGLMLLPFAPYTGIGTIAGSAPIANLGEFESQILSAARKERLGAASMARVAAVKRARRSRLAAPAPGTADTHQATTPQGLYAEVELPSADTAETLYHKVVLARSIAKLPAIGSVDFGFENLTPELQNLFETNQLMAVIVNPAKLGAQSPGAVRAAAAGPIFDHDVVIADWRMTAAVGSSLNATAYANILILKYCDGTLQERVANPNKWVGTDTFSLTASGGAEPSVALTGLSKYLQDYLKAGIDAAEKNTLYADFASIVTDPKWQGVIVLAADVDPSGFPDQIKGLTAGIDFTQFRAHHFGATATRVTVSGSTVTMEVPSSLFGLIDYQLPAFRDNVAAGGSPDMPLALPADGDFGFQVLQLQALFRNAALVDFRSHVQLTVNQLFLSPVTSAYGSIGKLPAQGVVLDGSYQRQGNTGVYVFQQNATTRFLLQSNALPSVAIQRVVFNTLSSGDEPGGDGLVRSRFLMSGALEFALLTVPLPDNAGVREADLLSFGQPPDALPTGPAQGLSFSGLDVSMTSPIDSPNAVTFVFETAKLALDAGASQPRAHSLYTDLALQVDGFIAGAEDKRPIDFGFLPVNVEPKTKALSGPWFAIAYKVTMGSPGGLVAKAGFASRLLLAWAPTSLSGETTTAVFTGLQLPGAAPGAKLLSIQGVLKLSIDSILLRREQVSGPDLSFTLRLNNVGLTFLGIVKLPPGATINFFLFGDPSGSGSLGWYAAYIEDNKTALAKLDGPPQLPSPPGASPSRLPEHTS
jgi:hypothetical protein